MEGKVIILGAEGTFSLTHGLLMGKVGHWRVVTIKVKRPAALPFRSLCSRKSFLHMTEFLIIPYSM